MTCLEILALVLKVAWIVIILTENTMYTKKWTKINHFSTFVYLSYLHMRRDFWSNIDDNIIINRRNIWLGPGKYKNPIYERDFLLFLFLSWRIIVKIKPKIGPRDTFAAENVKS